MMDRIRQRILAFLRVPAEPAAPFGAPGSLRVFRAGENYRKLLLIRWGLAQLGAVVGLCISIVFLGWVQQQAEQARARSNQPAAVTAPNPGNPPDATATEPTGKAKATKSTARSKRGDPNSGLQRMIERTPPWVISVLRLIEFGGVILFLVQIPVSFAAVRLEYELHWYIVTDRSLRIRTGLISVQESTMSFANVQQVVVTQGPLQRLLGLADVRIQSAGGGGGAGRPGHHEDDSLHTGVFHAVDNAEQIRDLIQSRLGQFRAAGLGDPDEPATALPSADGPPPLRPVLEAANELLHEARLLRAAVQGSPGVSGSA